MPLNLPDFLGAIGKSQPAGSPMDYYKTQQEAVTTRYSDKNAQADLLGKELTNIFNEIKNRTAHEKNVTDIAHTRAQTGSLGASTNKTNLESENIRQKQQALGPLWEMIAQAMQQQASPQQTPAFNQDPNQQPGMWPGYAQSRQGYGQPGGAAQAAPPAQGMQGQPQNGQMSQLQQLLKQPIIGELLAKELGINSGVQPLTGHAANIASYNRVMNDPSIPDDQKTMLKDLYETELGAKKSTIERKEMLNRLAKFNALPANAKENLLAGYRALGLDELTAQENIAEGKTPGKVAEEMGYSKEQAAALDKQYAPTNATITKIQDAEGALAEEQILGPYIAENLGPDSRTILGYSPSQIINSFNTGKVSKSKQAKFLAARALAAEQSAIRARMANASNAQEALRDLKSMSLNEMGIFRSLVSPEVYMEAQHEIDKVLTEMVEARVKAMKGIKTKPQAKEKDLSKYSEQELLEIINAN